LETNDYIYPAIDLASRQFQVERTFKGLQEAAAAEIRRIKAQNQVEMTGTNPDAVTYIEKLGQGVYGVVHKVPLLHF
jgi:hypothetical protein